MAVSYDTQMLGIRRHIVPKTLIINIIEKHIEDNFHIYPESSDKDLLSYVVAIQKDHHAEKYFTYVGYYIHISHIGDSILIESVNVPKRSVLEYNVEDPELLDKLKICFFNIALEIMRDIAYVMPSIETQRIHEYLSNHIKIFYESIR